MLEAGNGNPNIETLWAIASALKVPFGQLIDASGTDIRVVKKGEGISVDTKDRHMRAELLASRSRRGAFEFYQIHLVKGTDRQTEPHKKGTSEHIFVIKGKLVTGPQDNPLTLNAGDLASFPADVAHVYQAPHSDVTALVIMDYL